MNDAVHMSKSRSIVCFFTNFTTYNINNNDINRLNLRIHSVELGEQLQGVEHSGGLVNYSPLLR